MSDSVQPHGHQPTRVLCPRDSSGKNTGVGCHFPSPYQIESGRYLTLGRSCGKFPSSFSVPRGKALLGTTAHHGISASSLSGSVPGIWEAKPRQPLPLLQEILVQGVWRADTWPLPRGEPPGCSPHPHQHLLFVDCLMIAILQKPKSSNSHFFIAPGG